MPDLDRDSTHIIKQHLRSIETVVSRVARRRRLDVAEREELLSDVVLKCLRNDCRVLRKFEGRSCIETYLTAVADRALLDRRVKEWGRWRSSAAAKRLGEPAIKLEELVWRDRFSAEEAIEILRTNCQVEMPRTELLELVSRLPARRVRRVASGAPVEDAPVSERADERLRHRERRVRARQVEYALSSAFGALPPADREIVRLRFALGLTVAQIARRLGLHQRSLYSRLARILRRLRKHVESRGLSAVDARELSGWSGTRVEIGL